jgi:4-nitrophenyl phosphatase
MEILINEFDTFFFDLEGVIWYGGRAIPFAVEVINRLTALNKPVYFLTNASDFSRNMIITTLDREGISHIKDNIFVCSYATNLYLKSNGFRKVFAIGMEGLMDELSDVEVISSIPFRNLELKTPDDFVDL